MMTAAEQNYVDTQDQMLAALYKRDLLSKQLAHFLMAAGMKVSNHMVRGREPDEYAKFDEKKRLLREAEAEFQKAMENFRVACDKLKEERAQQAHVLGPSSKLEPAERRGKAERRKK
jgi:hypothetical protein